MSNGLGASSAVSSSFIGLAQVARKELLHLPAVESRGNAAYMAGYSGTPLPQKLGIKPGSRLGLFNAAEGFRQDARRAPGRGQNDHEARRFARVAVFSTDKGAELTKAIRVLGQGHRACGGALGIVAEEELRRKNRPRRARGSSGRSRRRFGRRQGVCDRRDLVGSSNSWFA